MASGCPTRKSSVETAEGQLRFIVVQVPVGGPTRLPYPCQDPLELIENTCRGIRLPTLNVGRTGRGALSVSSKHASTLPGHTSIFARGVGLGVLSP